MNPDVILPWLRSVGRALADHLYAVMRDSTLEERVSIYKDTPEDFIYQIDKIAEDLLVAELETGAASLGGVTVIAEGIGDGAVTFPRGLPATDATVALLIDPIDGTRGLMYDKRSAFFLAGAAPARGIRTRLSDIQVAVMVELPTSRSHVSDALWAVRGHGAGGDRRDLATGTVVPCVPQPSRAPSIYGGFSEVSRFFSPGRDVLAQVEEDLMSRLFPDAPAGKAYIFEDQYISTGGQLYEMLMGKDRFIADVRTGLYALFARQGKRIGHVCHPYDVAAHLIGTEAGLLITDRTGNELDGPFDTDSGIDWIAYANANIKREVENVFQHVLMKYDLF